MNRRIKSIEVKTKNIFIILLDCSFWSNDLLVVSRSYNNTTTITLKNETCVFDSRSKFMVDQDIARQLRRL